MSHYAECRYAECRYAEYRGALSVTIKGGYGLPLKGTQKFNSSYSSANIFAVRIAFCEFYFKFKLTT